MRSRSARPRRTRSLIGWVWVCGGRAPGEGSTMSNSWHKSQKAVDGVRLRGGFVSPYAIDAREAHGQPRLVSGRAADAVEGDFEHQLRRHLADRPEAVGGVVAHPFVEPAQFLVGEA